MKAFFKTRLIIIYSLVAFLITSQSFGQDSLTSRNVFPFGIFFACGLGSYSVKDEYISNEKYSGSFPYFSAGWVKTHHKYVYRLEIEYRNSNEIRNNNVSTEITRFAQNQGFLYPLKKKSFLNNDLYIWLGPSTDFYFFYNVPNIAVSGFDYAQSYAALFSLGFNADAIYPLNQNFQVESSLKMSLLSLGFRMVDSEEDNQSPVKPFSSFSGLNASLNFGIRYYLFKPLSMQVAYKFEFTRISAWEPLLSASDNLIIGLNYRF